MKHNLLSDKLRQGRNVYGTCITSIGPLWPAAVAGTGLDFVFIDTEHIPLDRNELALLCQAFRAGGVSPIGGMRRRPYSCDKPRADGCARRDRMGGAVENQVAVALVSIGFLGAGQDPNRAHIDAA